MTTDVTDVSRLKLFVKRQSNNFQKHRPRQHINTAQSGCVGVIYPNTYRIQHGVFRIARGISPTAIRLAGGLRPRVMREYTVLYFIYIIPTLENTSLVHKRDKHPEKMHVVVATSNISGKQNNVRLYWWSSIRSIAAHAKRVPIIRIVL